MKVTGNLKQKNVSKTKKGSSAEKKEESQEMVWEQIKLEDLEQERSEVRKSVEKKTTSKKQAEKKSVSAAKTTAEVKAAEVTAEEPMTEEAAAAVETVDEEPEAAKKETKTRTRSTTAKSEEKKTKTPAAKKEEKETKTKTTAKAAVSEKIVLQIDNREDLEMSTLIDRVKAAYVAEGHKADAIKNIEVYIKMRENMVYYVIDGYASGISLYE